MEVQADERGEDRAVPRGVAADDVADDGLGVQARPRVEADLQLRRRHGGLHRGERQQQQQ